MTVLERLLENVVADLGTGCWQWIAGKDTHGYGQMKVAGRKVLAHRLSYERHIGPIPSGQCVCHSCDNPACINPKHLFLGTHTQNMHDMMAKGRGRKASQKGEVHGRAKLTEPEVVAIKTANGISQRKLAEIYGVSQSQISLIRLGKKWSHIQVVGAE